MSDDLIEILERAGELVAGPFAIAPPDAKWGAAAELVRDRSRIEELVGELTLEVGSDRRDVAAQRCIEGWTWSLAAAPAAVIAGEGRFLEIDPDALLVSVELDPYFMPRFAVPAASEASGGLPGFVDALATLMEPLVEMLNRVSGRPRAALWRGAGDRLADGFLYAGAQLGDHPRGEELAVAALGVPGPLAGPVVVDRVDVGPRAEPVHVRNGCCILHVVPGGVPCITCPLLDGDERRARTIEWLESEGRLR